MTLMGLSQRALHHLCIKNFWLWYIGVTCYPDVVFESIRLNKLCLSLSLIPELYKQ